MTWNEGPWSGRCFSLIWWEVFFFFGGVGYFMGLSERCSGCFGVFEILGWASLSFSLLCMLIWKTASLFQRANKLLSLFYFSSLFDNLQVKKWWLGIHTLELWVIVSSSRVLSKWNIFTYLVKEGPLSVFGRITLLCTLKWVWGPCCMSNFCSNLIASGICENTFLLLYCLEWN